MTKIEDRIDELGEAIAKADGDERWIAAATAAEGLGYGDPAKVAAGHLIGMKPDEIADVRRDRHGDLYVTTTDGTRLVVVDPANPDGAGTYGVMLADKNLGVLARPFPTFTPRGLLGRRHAKKAKAQERLPTMAEVAAEQAAARPAVPFPDDPQLIGLRMVVDSIEAERAQFAPGKKAGRNAIDQQQYEQPYFTERLAPLQQMIKLRIRKLEADEVAANWKPDPVDERRNRLVRTWALELLASATDFDRQDINRRYVSTEIATTVQLCGGDVVAVRRELASAEGWLTGHGFELDPDTDA